ncbi:Shedu anti-phage system protein SduA domain-containing protein [Arenibacter algicola]|uniref:Shedu anti-phage system protein SduA domain-containing protein n=1 Tax=Arenibacter algicola TaxID=616991 RepID=UPI0004DF0C4E|nr:Shedu anti-phage system protein SduA domain-containing protein [Arenibacter algicola]
MTTLKDKVEWHIDNGSPEDLSRMIIELYEKNNQEALSHVIMLSLCDFGGITQKMEYQNIAALGTLHWGIEGLQELTKATIEKGGFRALNNISRLISHISSRTLNDFLFSKFNFESIKKLELESDNYKNTEWVKTAKECLITLAREAEKDDKFPIGLMQNLGFSINEQAQEHMFAALMARWFNLDRHGIENYLELVNLIGKDEIDYQNYLKKNPYILEPFHSQIWSKPRFGESLIPDFLIRSMDDSYTVVEIEKADFQIMTKAGELSSKATHAKRQALDFRDWAINNNLYAIKRFPEIYRPFCLVVIGRESELDEMQTLRLKQENESTQGILKIVGFDWLYKRAKATFDNIVNYGFERDKYNETIEEE